MNIKNKRGLYANAVFQFYMFTAGAIALPVAAGGAAIKTIL